MWNFLNAPVHGYNFACNFHMHLSATSPRCSTSAKWNLLSATSARLYTVAMIGDHDMDIYIYYMDMSQNHVTLLFTSTKVLPASRMVGIWACSWTQFGDDFVLTHPIPFHPHLSLPQKVSFRDDYASCLDFLKNSNPQLQIARLIWVWVQRLA